MPAPGIDPGVDRFSGKDLREKPKNPALRGVCSIRANLCGAVSRSLAVGPSHAPGDLVCRHEPDFRPELGRI